MDSTRPEHSVGGDADKHDQGDGTAQEQMSCVVREPCFRSEPASRNAPRARIEGTHTPTEMASRRPVRSCPSLRDNGQSEGTQVLRMRSRS